MHTDQTGKFLYVSTRGYKYIRILYAYDFNAILSTSLRPKLGSDQLAGTKSIYERLNLKGHMTILHFMDNKEAPCCVTYYLQANDIARQLIPPNINRRNTA